MTCWWGETLHMHKYLCKVVHPEQAACRLTAACIAGTWEQVPGKSDGSQGQDCGAQAKAETGCSCSCCTQLRVSLCFGLLWSEQRIDSLECEVFYSWSHELMVACSLILKVCTMLCV